VARGADVKRAFLVLGAESSGTRLLTEVLIAGGCHGDATHHQPFDRWEFGEQTPILWRRSYPWSPYHLWPNLELDLLRPLRRHGYEDVLALVSTRDWLPTARSQADPKNRHAATEAEALANIALAYEEIIKQLAAARLPHLMVAHEALSMVGERAARALLRKLGLDAGADLPELDRLRNERRYS
jgi:hypothetical protein